MQFWLMKSEPETYSIDDLKEFQTDHWDGIHPLLILPIATVDLYS